MNELSKRIIAGIVMIAIAVAALWAGGIFFGLLVAACGLMMIAEWAGLFRATRTQTRILLALIGIFLLQGLLLANGAAGQFGPAMIGIVPASLWPSVGAIGGMVALLVLLGALGALLGRRLGLAAGLLYVGLPILALLVMRNRDDGLALTFWTLAVVWATDIGAFFAGRAIGGPKLAPRVSPSKTWSGLGGGVLAATITGAIIAWRMGLPPILLGLGAVMAVLAQAGDLFESSLKRRAGVKDSGRILPGHGGVLDRLDGVVPVATMIGALVWMGAL